jgi:putative salt-induced outer membrane protein YdiY
VKTLIVCALVPVALAAQDTTKAITFHADLGYVATTGNTNVSTINFANQLDWKTSSVNKIDETFSVIYGQNKNVVQTNIWTIGLRDEYALSKVIALYALGGFLRNTFAGVDYNFSEGGGVAFIPMLPKQHHLEIDAGFSYVEQQLLQPPLPDSTDHHAEARGALTYRYTFGKDTYAQVFVEGLPDLKNESDYHINSETDLVAPFSKHLALKVGYAIKYANLPPPGFRTTDKIFTSDLQVSF